MLAAVSCQKQPRSSWESHPRKLLTAAHAYSHNGSRITSFTAERLLAMEQGFRASPSRRPSPLLRAAGLPIPQTPLREQPRSPRSGIWKPLMPSYNKGSTSSNVKSLYCGTICGMRDAQQTLEQYFLEMRWRCLSLAADLDRIERASGGPELIRSDVRLKKLHDALLFISEPGSNRRRAEFVQALFSDTSPPPSRQ